MYIESSLPRQEGDYANLFSETFEIGTSPPNDMCLIFWYHMYGTGIGG